MRYRRVRTLDSCHGSQRRSTGETTVGSPNTSHPLGFAYGLNFQYHLRDREELFLLKVISNVHTGLPMAYSKTRTTQHNRQRSREQWAMGKQWPRRLVDLTQQRNTAASEQFLLAPQQIAVGRRSNG